MKSVLVAVAFAVIVAIVFVSSQGSSGQPYVGDNAANFKLTIDGKSADLESYKGKVVLIDFWATWCGPCKRAMPELQAAYDLYHPQGLELIGISAEKPEVIKGFLATTKFTYPNMADAEGAITKQYGVKAFPTEILVGKSGRVVYQSEGYDGEGLKVAIEKALKD